MLDNGGGTADSSSFSWFIQSDNSGQMLAVTSDDEGKISRLAWGRVGSRGSVIQSISQSTPISNST